MPSSFCLIRHDVDRKPENALNMAQLEHEFNIKSTYYFRTKSHVLVPDIIKEIEQLGHEIGYHYECLSDENGDAKKAETNFAQNLSKLRECASIKSISMHGRPLSKFDNRDMWKVENAKEVLQNKYEISGEIYLHIDYNDIAYIGDTGRNWHSDKSNKRDTVNSTINLNIKDGQELLELLEKKTPKKMVFQIHPERWTDNNTEHFIQKMKDSAINLAKSFL